MIREEEEDKTEKNELVPQETRANISIRRSSGARFSFFVIIGQQEGKNKLRGN
jgi:hypothetical protein